MLAAGAAEGDAIVASTDVVVIGGGQAGIAMSAMLTRRGVDHVVLERDAIAASWRGRWDSFTLVTPNWTVKLPGGEYDGPGPDGFMPRDEIVAHIERYARSFGAPVVTGIEATEVTARPTGGYRVTTNDGAYDARAVVVATGTFQQPLRPDVGTLDSSVMELHSAGYRSHEQLPDGGVLVVGSAQSGCQIAEELHEAGRRVYLSVSGAGRAPRRYRRRDVFRWLETIGFFERPVEALESPAERLAANPHASGKRGGHTINLHRFARDGIVLVGRVSGIDARRVRFASDLRANLEKADTFATELRGLIDKALARQGIEADPDDDSDDYDGRDGFDQPGIAELDLADEGIGSVIWSSGYRRDFSWVRPARIDDWGYPVQRADYADSRGLYFLGLHFLHKQKSGLLYGVGDEAAAIADHVVGRRPD
jgi:putative flavoprotein involved in K+ transport